jgi:phosphoserine phosphatase
VELVVLDVDGTLTPHRSIWQHLHQRLGVWTGDAERYWQQFRRGEIDYVEFCARDASHWRGLELALAQAWVDAVPYNPGVAEGLRRLCTLGLPVALLSTGLTLLTDRIHREFDLTWSLANHLPSHDGLLLGTAEVRIADGDKGAALTQLVDATGIQPSSMVGVGDGSNDVAVARRVGRFIAYRCTSDELASIADHVCVGEDFGEVVERIERWTALADRSAQGG